MNKRAAKRSTTRLQELIHRKGKVLVVLHPPTATHARIMEQAGCEAGFVGTSGVVGSYTGLADVGTATMTECVHVERLAPDGGEPVGSTPEQFGRNLALEITRWRKVVKDAGMKVE